MSGSAAIRSAWNVRRQPRGATRRSVLVGLAGTAALALWPKGARAEAAAAELVERFHEGLLGVMQEARTLGFSGRAQVLAPMVEATFDHATMTRIACGQAWDGIDAAMRSRLIDAFRRYAIANYAANFDDYSGQSFRTLAVEPGRGGRVSVRAELVRAPGRGAPVAFDYTVHQTAEGWRAIDVVIDGRMSELARRRSEFTAILRRGGVSELLATLEAQTQALAA